MPDCRNKQDVVMVEPLQIRDIVIYPIKSLPGIRVSRAVVTAKGLIGYPSSPERTKPGQATGQCLRDRECMIVDEQGTFLTLRTHADIFTQIEVTVEDAYLVLRAPKITQKPLKISLEADHQEDSLHMNVRVWSWEGQARIISQEASLWISDVLGKPSHIVRCDGMNHHRPVDGTWVTERARATAQATFADGFPYLFVFEESFNDLKTNLEGIDFSVDRFRGNILISGGTAWQEDCTRVLVVKDSLEFDLVKPCTRCKVPTIHPRTGSVDPVVYDVLVRKRSGVVLGWDEPKSFKHSTFFGVNGVFHDSMYNTSEIKPFISIGDSVTLMPQ